MINLKIYCENKNLYYEQFQSFCVLCVLCSVTKSCFPELWKNHEFLKYYNIIKPLKSIRRILKTFLKKETYFWKISVILCNLCTVQCGEILFPWTLEKSWVSKTSRHNAKTAQTTTTNNPPSRLTMKKRLLNAKKELTHICSLILISLCSCGPNMSKKIAETSSAHFYV